MIMLILFSTISCQNDDTENPNIDTGVFGKIEYGMGDCMPIINESIRKYSNYNGEIYFIIKSDLENLGNDDFEVLKSNSIHTTINNGELEVELPIGVYLVMPNDVYLYSDYNTVKIESGIALHKDFKFWKCTSY
ncbi:MAG: hypothetical protein WC389_06715 [Lutibacter sp.]